MNKLMLLLLMLIGYMHNDACATTWPEILHENASLLQNNGIIVKTQYECFAKGATPAIAHPAIKSIAIVENDEPLVDIRTMGHPRISMLPDASVPFASPDCNSGLPKASLIRCTVFKKLTNMVPYLDQLAPEFGYKPGEISIKVFEGLRDLQTQEHLFKNKMTEIKVANPHMTDEEAEAETAKWVSPFKNNVPVHSTGAAIDIRLWNETTHDFVDLGKFGTIWGENKGAQTFSESITDQQKLNRLFLLLTATQVGLVNYTYEYWHYSCGDRYATYWQEKDVEVHIASYGAVR